MHKKMDTTQEFDPLLESTQIYEAVEINSVKQKKVQIQANPLQDATQIYEPVDCHDDQEVDNEATQAYEPVEMDSKIFCESTQRASGNVDDKIYLEATQKVSGVSEEDVDKDEIDGKIYCEATQRYEPVNKGVQLNETGDTSVFEDATQPYNPDDSSVTDEPVTASTLEMNAPTLPITPHTAGFEDSTQPSDPDHNSGTYEPPMASTLEMHASTLPMSPHTTPEKPRTHPEGSLVRVGSKQANSSDVGSPFKRPQTPERAKSSLMFTPEKDSQSPRPNIKGALKTLNLLDESSSEEDVLFSTPTQTLLVTPETTPDPGQPHPQGTLKRVHFCDDQASPITPNIDSLEDSDEATQSYNTPVQSIEGNQAKDSEDATQAYTVPDQTATGKETEVDKEAQSFTQAYSLVPDDEEEECNIAEGATRETQAFSLEADNVATQCYTLEEPIPSLPDNDIPRRLEKNNSEERVENSQSSDEGESEDPCSSILRLPLDTSDRIHIASPSKSTEDEMKGDNKFAENISPPIALMHSLKHDKKENDASRDELQPESLKGKNKGRRSTRKANVAENEDIQTDKTDAVDGKETVTRSSRGRRSMENNDVDSKACETVAKRSSATDGPEVTVNTLKGKRNRKEQPAVRAAKAAIGIGRRLSKSHQDVEQVEESAAGTLQDVAEALPEVSDSLPDITDGLPEVSDSLPDIADSLPDISQNIQEEDGKISYTGPKKKGKNKKETTPQKLDSEELQPSGDVVADVEATSTRSIQKSKRGRRGKYSDKEIDIENSVNKETVDDVINKGSTAAHRLNHDSVTDENVRGGARSKRRGKVVDTVEENEEECAGTGRRGSARSKRKTAAPETMETAKDGEHNKSQTSKEKNADGAAGGVNLEKESEHKTKGGKSKKDTVVEEAHNDVPLEESSNVELPVRGARSKRRANAVEDKEDNKKSDHKTKNDKKDFSAEVTQDCHLQKDVSSTEELPTRGGRSKRRAIAVASKDEKSSEHKTKGNKKDLPTTEAKEDSLPARGARSKRRGNAIEKKDEIGKDVPDNEELPIRGARSKRRGNVEQKGELARETSEEVPTRNARSTSGKTIHVKDTGDTLSEETHVENEATKEMDDGEIDNHSPAEKPMRGRSRTKAKQKEAGDEKDTVGETGEESASNQPTRGRARTKAKLSEAQLKEAVESNAAKGKKRGASKTPTEVDEDVPSHKRGRRHEESSVSVVDKHVKTNAEDVVGGTLDESLSQTAKGRSKRGAKALAPSKLEADMPKKTGRNSGSKKESLESESGDKHCETMGNKTKHSNKKSEEFKTPSKCSKRSHRVEKESESNETPSKKRRGERDSSVDSQTSESSTRSVKSSPSIVRGTDSPLGTASLRKIVKPKIMFTGVSEENFTKIIEDLGGEVAKSPIDATHLVTDEVRRTVKFLCCIARGVPIVNPEWLKGCRDAHTFIDTSPFTLKDAKYEKEYKTTLTHTLDKAGEARLFTGYKIHVTKSVKPQPKDMKDIVTCAGGEYLASLPRKFSDNTVIVSCEEDVSSCQSAVAAGLPCVTKEFILTGLLKHHLDVETYALKVESTKKPKGRR